MRLILTALALVCFSFVAFGQNSPKYRPNFDVVDFSKKSELAEWLIQYDTVAWKTSDVAVAEDKSEIAKLGAEWFCFQDSKNVWHAVYGKYENEKYELVFHYLMDAAEKVTKTTEKVDQSFLNTHAKALVTAKARLMAKIPQNSPNFNQYIRRNSDNTFDVWMFPAFQTNGVAVYGMEGIYQIDSTGSKIITDTSYFQDGLRGFKSDPPREIWLNYRELEKPSLGSVFFVWYYKTYFTNIYIDNSKSTSTVVKDGKNGYLWVNVEKDDKKVAKPNREKSQSLKSVVFERRSKPNDRAPRQIYQTPQNVSPR